MLSFISKNFHFRSVFKKRFFTLIELLVVIAIIALLASLIILYIRNVKEKAKLSRGLNFSQSLLNSLGFESVGWWSFERIEGGKTPDLSGHKNDGIVHGATIVNGLEVQGGGTGNAFNFDGTDYVEVNHSESLMFSDEITVECWVYFRGENGGDTQTIIMKNPPFSISLQKPFNGRIHVEFTTESGSVGFNSTEAVAPRYHWTHIALTYRNDAKHEIQVYVNGELKIKNNWCSGKIVNGPPYWNLYIGNYLGSQYFFDGKIDEVRIYRKALTPAQIKNHYLAGLKRYITFSK